MLYGTSTNLLTGYNNYKEKEVSEGGVIGCERNMILIWLGYQVDNLSNSAIKLCSETRLVPLRGEIRESFKR